MNLNFDQYEDRSQELAELARAVNMLVSVLMNKDGQPRDIADKEGREALIRAISDIPRKIPAELTKSDRELLKEHIDTQKKQQQLLIEQYEENRKLNKSWFWWIAGVCGVASGLIALCVVLLSNLLLN